MDDAEKKVVLAVDDSPVHLSVLANFLKNKFTLMAFKTAGEALNHMDAAVIDIILLDIEMPGLSGFEFLRTVRKKPKYWNVPVIIVSGHTEDDVVNHAMKAGADDFVGKPVNQEELLQKIETLLNNPPKHSFF
jgi:putative two-component system response regulator